MKILLAPDSFKGSLTSSEVITCLEKASKMHFPNAIIIKVPIADGGEGTVDSLVTAGNGEYREVVVTGPNAKKVKARYGILKGKTAILEMAQASGIALLNGEEKNPLITTTYGTGEMIKAVLDEGIRDIVIGIGGSATNDGGVGAAQALGISFTKEDGEEIEFGGKELIKIRNISMENLDPRIKDTKITVICDVNNPLTGTVGATMVYGPQKGANEKMLLELEEGMENYASIIKKQLKKDINTIPGAGAAGGLGGGLVGLLGGILKPGIDTILELIDFQSLLEGVDLVVTGEGKIDSQSIYGKVPIGIARYCKKRGIRVVALVGVMGEGVQELYSCGIDSIMTAVNRDMTIEDALTTAEELLMNAADRMFRFIRVGYDMKK